MVKVSKNRPEDWDFLYFSKDLYGKDFAPTFQKFAEPHEFLPNTLGTLFHVVTIKEGWNFGKTMPVKEVREHSMFEAILLDPIGYAETLVNCNYYGMMCKITVDDHSYNIVNSFYQSKIGVRKHAYTTDTDGTCWFTKIFNRYFKFHKGNNGGGEGNECNTANGVSSKAESATTPGDSK